MRRGRRMDMRRFGLLFGATMAVMVPFLVATPGGAATPTITIAGFQNPRVDDWGISESCLATTRTYLADTANFGPSGTVKATYATPTGIDTATAANLTGVDVFFVGYVPTSSYTTAEKTALLNYVKAGGAMIVTSDAPSYDLSSIFGVTDASSPGGLETADITDAASPLADGPFGTVSSFDEYDTVSHFSGLGPAHEVGANPEGSALAVIPPGALSATSGPVVLVSDVDVFSDCTGTHTPTGSVQNETLIKNIFAYVATAKATPVTTTTASTTTTEAPTTTAPPAVSAEPAFTG
jgi:hypothetical protein